MRLNLLGSHSSAIVLSIFTCLLISLSVVPSAHAVAMACTDLTVDDADISMPADCEYRLTESEARAEGIDVMSQGVIPDSQAGTEAPPPVEVELVRTCCGTQCVFGQISVGGENVCKTLELPDHGNQPSISCVPAGDYTCKLVYSPRFKKKLYELQQVDGRTHILIHTGNTPGDTEGCILVGTSIDVDKNRINDSRKGYQKLVDKLNNCSEFKLKIRDRTGTPTPAPSPAVSPTAVVSPAPSPRPSIPKAAVIEFNGESFRNLGM
jgi:hypothetical protein